MTKTLNEAIQELNNCGACKQPIRRGYLSDGKEYEFCRNWAVIKASLYVNDRLETFESELMSFRMIIKSGN